MQEINYPHSLFFLPKNKTEAVVITTNGQVRSDGSAVMGKGQALEATKWFKDIDKRLGVYLRKKGNRVYNMGVYGDNTQEMTVLTFPTKEHWKDKSSLSLIQKSAQELKEAADFYKLSKVYLPLVGCGCGGLDYQTEVRPLLMNILDDRFVVVQGYKG